MEIFDDRRPHSMPQTSRCSWDIQPDIQGNRPATSYVFPKRFSKNPFFVRNNPHPGRVRHIKGLLDIPICAVMDANFKEGMPNPSNAMRLPVLGVSKFSSDHGRFTTIFFIHDSFISVKFPIQWRLLLQGVRVRHKLFFLMLSQYEQIIELLSPLKSSENLYSDDDFRGNRS